MVLYINSYYGSLKKRKRKRGRAPEGETSFPYGINKNSCFLLAP